jgi:alkylhydroperoxidase family enzyme
VLDDWHSAPIDEKLRVMLGFLEKVTLTPGEVGPDDIAPLRAAGVTDQAIEDALYVCAYFNLIDRLADSFGFFVPPAEVIEQRAAFLLEHGYLQSIRPLP